MAGTNGKPCEGHAEITVAKGSSSDFAEILGIHTSPYRYVYKEMGKIVMGSLAKDMWRSQRQ